MSDVPEQVRLGRLRHFHDPIPRLEVSGRFGGGALIPADPELVQIAAGARAETHRRVGQNPENHPAEGDARGGGVLAPDERDRLVRFPTLQTIGAAARRASVHVRR